MHPSARIIWLACLIMIVAVVSGCVASSGPSAPRQTSLTTTTSSILPTSTTEAASVEVKKITSEKVNEAVWAPNGVSIFYMPLLADSNTPCCIQKWRRLDLQSMQVEKVDNAPGHVNEFTQLTWLEESIPTSQTSPDGEHVIYQRTPEGYVPPTPPPKYYHLDPFELWSAKLDGSEKTRLWAWKLGCLKNIIPSWFMNGKKVIVTCYHSDGGLFQRAVVNIDGSKAQTFSEWVGIPEEKGTPFNINFRPIVWLSPDDSQVVFNKENGELWIGLPEAKAAPEKILDFGFWPRWSLDGRHIYFLSTNSSSPVGVPDITVYNLVEKTSKVILSKDILGKANGKLEIGKTGEWQFSPNGNAILAKTLDSELWLISWR